MTDELQNKFGQVMQSKGLATRQRIIETTLSLLASMPMHKLSTAEVARACGLTRPALYVYFEGVPEVILAKLEEVKGRRHRYMEVLEAPWPEPTRLECAVAFVRAYADYWEEYDVPLRYRNLMSELGDARFMKLRVDMTQPVVERLAHRIAAARRQQNIPQMIDAVSAAGAALSLVDHAAMTVGTPYGDWGPYHWKRDAFFEAIAYMVVSLVRDDAQT